MISAAVVLGHGVGGRTDLPVPTWMAAYGAAAVVLVSFAALAAFWRDPRLAAVRPGPVVAGGSPFSRIALVGFRAVGIGLFALVVAAAFFGEDEVPVNLAPVAVYVTLWVGVALASAFIGDVYALLDPFETLTGSPDDDPDSDYTLGMWPASALLLVFVWLELVLPNGSSPRVVAVFLAALLVVVLGGTFRYGRPFLVYGNPFRAWFGLLAAMAPLGDDARGRVRLRWPIAGLARVSPVTGLLPLVLIVLGSTAFDGITRTQRWTSLTGDLRGAMPTVAGTIGLLLSIAFVTVAYLGAIAIAARLAGAGEPPMDLARDFAHTVVPIAFAYAVAHYLSLFLFEGQAFLALLSDPFGSGTDIFGTARNAVDYTLVSPRTISYLQVAAIVIGHVIGVALAHDRALERFRGSDVTRSQYPLLVVMVLFTVGGLVLLLGG